MGVAAPPGQSMTHAELLEKTQTTSSMAEVGDEISYMGRTFYGSGAVARMIAEAIAREHEQDTENA